MHNHLDLEAENSSAEGQTGDLPEAPFPPSSPASAPPDAEVQSKAQAESEALQKRLARSWSLWLAGVGPKVAADCTDAEHRKLGAIGYTILVPTVLGLFAAAYTTSTLSSNPYVITAIALGWGFIVLTIDRAIVATLRQSLAWWNKIVQFGLRVVIAALMALTISHPLTLLVFKDSVRREVERSYREDAERDNKALDETMMPLQQEIASIQAQLDVPPSQKFDAVSEAESSQVAAARTRLEGLRADERRIAGELAITLAELKRANQDYEDEVNGRRASGLPKEGPIARQILETRIPPLQGREKALTGEKTQVESLIAKADAELARLQADDNERKQREREDFLATQSRMRQASEAKKEKLETEIGRLRAIKVENERKAESLVASMQPGSPHYQQPDILTQTMALHRLFKDPQRGGEVASIAFFALLALFIAIDIMPVLVKFSTKRGEHDERIDYYHLVAKKRSEKELREQFPDQAMSEEGSQRYEKRATNSPTSALVYGDSTDEARLSHKGVAATGCLLILAVLAGSLWIDSGVPALLDHDYLPEILALQEQGRVAEAIALAKAISSLPGMPHETEILTLSHQMEADYNGWCRKIADFFQGIATGKTDSPESFGGAFLSDFFFIGDVRDLSIEGLKLMRGEDSDPVLIALSTFGAAVDVATWIPEPTSTAAGLSAGPVVTILKSLRKLGALTERFADAIRRTFEACLKSGKLGPARDLLDHFGGILKKAPPGGMKTLMKHVESSEDLAAVSLWTAKNPEGTFAALHVGGKDAIEWMKRAGKNADAELGRLLRQGGRAFKPKLGILRGSKAIYRGRIGELFRVLRDLAAQDPHVRRILFLTASGAVAWAGFLNRRLLARFGRWIGGLIQRFRQNLAVAGWKGVGVGKRSKPTTTSSTANPASNG